ncbi:hypothetical protein GKN94_11380 [Candidatus Lucifugimonas marina]|uniref:hypothetical protein n=1 Tax=Candidatus Lucifugimonas marina TaxID=3038979 RepID=UPI00279B94CF|nr:hypothetical protein GKN94_11380 [SAR202 cluster bacterium JH545]
MDSLSYFKDIEAVVLRNPDVLHEHVASGIFETLEFFDFARTASEETDVESFKIHGSVGFTFWAGHEPDPTSLPNRFADWITSVSLRRLIEIYSEYLNKAILAAEHRDGHPASDEAELERRSLNERIGLLHQKLGSEGRKSMNSYKKKLSSVNWARNILEHRRGIVSERDARSGTFRLQFEQRVITPAAFDAEEGNLAASVSHRNVVLKFNAGDTILLSSTDLTNICQTFANHAMRVTRGLKNEPFGGSVETTYTF